MGACIVSDEECKLVFVKRHVVDDGSKDAGILGSTRGGEDNDGQFQNPLGHGSGTVPSFDLLGCRGSP